MSCKCYGALTNSVVVAAALNILHATKAVVATDTHIYNYLLLLLLPVLHSNKFILQMSLRTATRAAFLHQPTTLHRSVYICSQDIAVRWRCRLSWKRENGGAPPLGARCICEASLLAVALIAGALGATPLLTSRRHHTPTFARSLLQLRAVGAGAFYVYFIRVCPFCCCAKNAKMPNMHSRQLCQLLLLLCAACANVMRNSQLRRWQVPTNGIVLTVVVASQLAALRQLWSSTFFNAVLTFASEPL